MHQERMKQMLAYIALLTLTAASTDAMAQSIQFRSAAVGQCSANVHPIQYEGGFLISTGSPEMIFQCAIDAVGLNTKRVVSLTAYVNHGSAANPPIQVRVCARTPSTGWLATCGPTVQTVAPGVQRVTALPPAVAETTDWMLYLEVVVPDFEVPSYSMFSGFHVTML